MTMRPLRRYGQRCHDRQLCQSRRRPVLIWLKPGSSIAMPDAVTMDAKSPACAHSAHESPATAVLCVRIEPFKVACSSCNLRELCLPVGMSDEQIAQARHPGGDAPRRCRAATRCSAAATPSSRCTRCAPASSRPASASEDGRDQVTGFQMAGELLGLDGIGTDRHTCDAVALEDSQVCVIPYPPARGTVARGLRPAAPVPPHHEPRDRARPWRDAAAGQHARRGAAGRLPAQPDAAPAAPRLLGQRADPAHDARGDRQLPGPEARDREPHLLEVPGRRPARGQAAPDPHPRPGRPADAWSTAPTAEPPAPRRRSVDVAPVELLGADVRAARVSAPATAIDAPEHEEGQRVDRRRRPAERARRRSRRSCVGSTTAKTSISSTPAIRKAGQSTAIARSRAGGSWSCRRRRHGRRGGMVAALHRRLRRRPRVSSTGSAPRTAITAVATPATTTTAGPPTTSQIIGRATRAAAGRAAAGCGIVGLSGQSCAQRGTTKVVFSSSAGGRRRPRRQRSTRIMIAVRARRRPAPPTRAARAPPPAPSAPRPAPTHDRPGRRRRRTPCRPAAATR